MANLFDFKPEGDKISLLDRISAGAKFVFYSASPVLMVSDAVTGNSSQVQRAAALIHGRNYSPEELTALNARMKENANNMTSALPWYLNPNDNIGKYVLVGIAALVVAVLLKLFFPSPAKLIEKVKA